MEDRMAGRRRSNAAYKRQSEQHHAYNRQYSREHYIPAPEEQTRESRSRAGKASGAARSQFTADDIVTIRRRHAAGTRVSELAREYSAGVMTISDIVNRKTWKEVE